MSDLMDLYQEMIVDHSKSPRNFRVMGDFTKKADGFNPLCGDKVTVFVKVKGDLIEDVSFQGQGCAISTSSASLLTDILKGKTISQAEELFAKFHSLITTGAHADGLGKLEVFGGVVEFPSRVKCAALPWHALKSALQDQGVVSTEA